MSFCFQALPLLPSFLITKAASAVVWQTSTNICWWQTTWTWVTAWCYRNFLVNFGAPGGETKSSAPWTAARAMLRLKMRCGDFFHRQQDLRREKRPNLKLWKPRTPARLLLYRVTTHGSHPETNRLSMLRRLHETLLKKVPVTRSFTLLVTVMKLQTLRTTCGGLGRGEGWKVVDIRSHSWIECL